MTKEIDLLENKEMRDNLVERLDVLDKVGSLLLLDELQMATTEQVAKYFSTTVDTIKMCVSNNREEIELDGYKVVLKEELQSNLLTNNLSLKTKRGGFDILDNNGNVVASGSNKGVALFPKRAILRVGMLLRDSEVANNVREELGLPHNTKIGLRKEIEFKKLIDLAIEEVVSLYVKKYENQPNENPFKKIIPQKVKEFLSYETQCNVCDGDYRVDFYFKNLEMAIEYDEKYHLSKSQQKKDMEREYRIKRYFYMNNDKKDFSKAQVSVKDVNEWGFTSYEDMFDFYYKEWEGEGGIGSWELVEFFRVQEGKEIEAIIKLSCLFTYRAEELVYYLTY